jgi:hypothetical protein
MNGNRHPRVHHSRLRDNVEEWPNIPRPKIYEFGTIRFRRPYLHLYLPPVCESQ